MKEEKVDKSEDKGVPGKQWKRIHNLPDVQLGHATRAKANVNTMASESFKKACSDAGIPATKRQASKYNNKRGAAYRASHIVA